VNAYQQQGLLRNDTEVSVGTLAGGVHVVCDAVLDRSAVQGKPVCFVTLDMPFPSNSADRQLWGASVIGFQPLTLRADVGVDSTAPHIISWTPTQEAQKWLRTVLFLGIQNIEEIGLDRVLARLTLKGNFIWSQDNPESYLDGEVFGGRQPGGQNTDLRLPSGDSRRGGDFEMWFWLVR